MATVENLIDIYVASDIQILFHDFITQINQRFYSVDLEFMEFFTQLCSYNGQFVVHNQTLIAYGIIPSDCTDMKQRLEALNLNEGEDFELLNIKDKDDKQECICSLTPDAFKLALMQSPKSPYAKYFLFLEKMTRYYMIYQTKWEEKHMNKTSRFDELVEMTDIMLDEAEDAKKDRTVVIEKLDTIIAMLQRNVMPF